MCLITLWGLLFSLLYLILQFSFVAESKHEDWDILILTFSASFVACQKEDSFYCSVTNFSASSAAYPRLINIKHAALSDWQKNCSKSHERIVSSPITGKCSEDEMKAATVAQPLCHYTLGVCSRICSGLHHRNKRSSPSVFSGEGSLFALYLKRLHRPYYYDKL